MMRVTVWAVGLFVLVGLFGLSLVSGSSLLLAAVVLASAALLWARIVMLNGPAELRRRATDAMRTLDAALDATRAQVRTQRRSPSEPMLAGDDRAQNSEGAAAWAQRFVAALGSQSSATAPHGGALTLRQKALVGAVLLAFGVPLALRVFRLADFQAEPYGDINIVFESVQKILRGDRPFEFTLSSGPLYHYMIAPLVAIVGFDYLGLKLASATVSVLVIWFVYSFGRSIVGQTFGLLSAFVAGVSSWLLIFSRLGNSQIVVPLLVICALWAAARFLQSGRSAYVVVCAAAGTLGLYGYPQSFIIAPTMAVTLLTLKACGHMVPWRTLGLFAITFVVLALPFLILLSADAGNITGPYIFDKINGAEQPLQTLAKNFVKSMAAFHVQGDEVFRSNPAGRPHLDAWSGVFMLAGIGFWLRKGTRRWFPLSFVPFLLLQSPAMLVMNFQAEVPSASRTLGVAPIVYFWVASGMWWAIDALRRRLPRTALSPYVTGALAVGVLAVITQANVQRYFVEYGDGLPYGNTPIARTAVNYLDTLPAATNAYLFHCCWESGMPEPMSIQFDMRTPRRLVEITAPTLTCETLDAQITRPAVLLWDFRSPLPDPNLQACVGRLPAQLHTAPNGRPVFYSAVVLP